MSFSVTQILPENCQSPFQKDSKTLPRILLSEHEHIRDDDLRVYYEEGINVGYRYFDAMRINPQFPFGFGLSYTRFDYENLKVNKQKLEGLNDQLFASVDVTNTGSVRGSEVIQVYSSDNSGLVQRPPKELVGFEKVSLKPNETASISIPIDGRDLAYYDVKKHGWRAASGEFNLLAGISSRCEFLTETIVCYE